MQMIRSDLLAQNDISFREGIIHEDEIFTFKCIFSAVRASHLPEALFNRRVRGSSTMTSRKGLNNFIGYGTCLEEVSDFLSGRALDEETMKAVDKCKQGYVKAMIGIYKDDLSEEERATLFSDPRLDTNNQFRELAAYCNVLEWRYRKAKRYNSTSFVRFAKKIARFRNKVKKKMKRTRTGSKNE
jgi:hypothetical protein